MKIGVNLNCYGPLPLEEQFSLLKRYGFDTTFCISENPLLAEAIALAKREGIVFETLHAPYREINAIWSAGEEGEAFLARLIASVESCAANEIPTLVVHLSSGLTPPRINDLGNERFDRLMEVAHREGVKIAYENQRMIANLAMAMEVYPEAVFCWDVGHEACFTGDRDYMALFSKRIGALHLQDNLCEFNKDLHLIPYDGAIDMENAAKRLAQSDYKGSIMLELVRSKWEGYAKLTPDEYYAKAADAARRFGARVESYRG
ncbi:MAG: sugar phosphate isomerase/epimerase [Clostridia bacterium]|nr:sugar phosphate isomerase/epimerase [Clostridia bacterium]